MRHLHALEEMPLTFLGQLVRRRSGCHDDLRKVLRLDDLPDNREDGSSVQSCFVELFLHAITHLVSFGKLHLQPTLHLPKLSGLALLALPHFVEDSLQPSHVLHESEFSLCLNLLLRRLLVLWLAVLAEVLIVDEPHDVLLGEVGSLVGSQQVPLVDLQAKRSIWINGGLGVVGVP